MPILDFKTDDVGLVATVPRIIYIDTDDTVTTVTTLGYLNDLVQRGYDIRETDMALISTKASASADPKSAWYEISKSGDDWSVVPPVSSGDVSLPTVDETLAYFTNTGGELASTTIVMSDAGAVTSVASVQVDNININGNTISSTDTNGAITSSPNGSGANALDSDTVYVGNSIESNDDSTTSIDFGTDTQDFLTNSSSRLDISDSGVRAGGANSRVTTTLDEDDFSSDSATALVTQQSAKAYVDNNSGGGWTYLVKGSDQTSTSATATAVTGLSFTPAANTIYEVEIIMLIRSSSTSHACQLGISWPSGLTDGAFNLWGGSGSAPATTGALYRISMLNKGDTVLGAGTSNFTIANESLIGFGAGIINCGAGVSGTLAPTFSIYTGAATATIRAGSILKYRIVG